MATGGAYDYINSLDLTQINTNLTVALTPSINFYDFDLNGFLNAIEQGIILNYHGTYGWIGLNGDGVAYPAAGTFDTTLP